MAIIEHGGSEYPVIESAEEVRVLLRGLLASGATGDGATVVELDLVKGGQLFVTAAGSVVAVRETPPSGRSVGF